MSGICGRTKLAGREQRVGLRTSQNLVHCGEGLVFGIPNNAYYQREIKRR